MVIELEGDQIDVRARGGLTECKPYDYCFTLNNYTDAMIDRIREFSETECEYFVFQFEI